MQQPGMQNRLDREPDVFEFSLPNVSGKFFLDHQGKWRVQSNKNIRVIMEESDIINPFFNNDLSSNYAPKAIHKFTLIDDLGVKYTFGSSNSATAAIEYSSSITPPDYLYRMWLIATSWYLQKIELPSSTGNIDFFYERGPFQSNFQYHEGQNRFFIEPCNPGSSNASNYYVKGISGTIYSPVYPKSLTTSSGVTVDFKFSKSNELAYPSSIYMEPLRDADDNLPSASLHPQYFAFLNAYYHSPYYANNSVFPSGVNNSCFVWLKLDSLTISNFDITNASTKVPFQRLHFNYRENNAERLKLTSVDFKGNLSSGTNQTYAFAYTSNSTIDYVSNLTDHWGFANKTFLIKNASGWYYWLTGNVLDSRKPDFAYCSSETLNYISFPTGGKTILEYELNEYGNYLIDNRQFVSTGSGKAGGLRVKKITTIDIDGKSRSKEFFYVNNYSNTANINALPSSGVLARLPRYTYSLNYGSRSFYIYSSNSISPLTSNSGLFCTYSEVAEKYPDGGYRIFKFTNYNNGYIDQPAVNNITPYEMDVPTRSTDFERGQLLSEALYNSNNSLVQKTENTYTRIGSAVDSNFARSLKKEFGGYCIQLTLPNPYYEYQILSTDGFQVPVYNSTVMNPNSFVPNFTTATAYGHYAYKFLKDKTVQTIYPQGGSGAQPVVTELQYQYDQWGNTTKITETNSKDETIYTNYKYPYHFAGTPVYDEMIKRNMTGYPVYTEKLKGTTFLESTQTDYDFFNSSVVIKPRFIKTKVGAGALETVNRFNKYDANGNLLESQGIDGITKTFIWGHNNSRLLINIDGSDYSSAIALLNPVILANPANEQQLMDETDKVRTLPNAFVATYVYDANTGLSVKKIKDYNQKSRYYEYDNLARPVTVKDNDHNILEKNEYKYQEQFAYPYRNSSQFRIIQPTTVTCPEGYTYNGVGYTVPADKYGSFISLADADQKATGEIDQYGLAYANANAICYPYYSYAPCCSWGSPYSNFNLVGSTVDFSLVVFKQSGTTNWTVDNQIANLSGQLFIPSVQQVITVTSGGRTWKVTIKPTGQISLLLVSGSAPSASSSIQLSGTYNL